MKALKIVGAAIPILTLVFAVIWSFAGQSGDIENLKTAKGEQAEAIRQNERAINELKAQTAVITSQAETAKEDRSELKRDVKAILRAVNGRNR